MQRFWPVVMGLVLVLLAACSAVSAKAAPPEIHFGEDMCSECGMIINEPKFAGAYAYETAEGRYESFIFDDVGDMLSHMQKNQTLKAVNWWVHDYDSEEWIDATTAYYVVSDQIKSPMNHGIAAFASEEDATALAVTLDVAPVDWDRLRVEHALGEHHH